MKPNISISPVATSTTLTYGLQVDPSPLTISVGNENPTLGSFQLVVTNRTNDAVQVTSITLTIQVGAKSSCITTDSGNLQAATMASSKAAVWSVSLPGNASGAAQIILGPPETLTSVAIEAGGSVVLQIYEMPTSVVAGTSLMTIEEVTAGGSGQASFNVTTFPYGFYFDNLTATVQNGDTYVPVSQVGYNSPVTLLWESSVVDRSGISIFYSSNGGQQSRTPTQPGEWTSPALTSDTVFTVQVTASMSETDPDPVSASLTVPVAVRPGDVAANSITVSGAAQLQGDTVVSGPLQATGSVMMIQGAVNISVGTWSATTDGLVIGYICGPVPVANCMGSIVATCGSVMVGATGGYTNPAGMPYNYANLRNSFILPVSQGAVWSVGFSAFYGTVSYTFVFVPLGSGTAQLSQVSEAQPAPELASLPELSSQVFPAVRSLIEALLLDDSGERKKRLQSLLESGS